MSSTGIRSIGSHDGRLRLAPTPAAPDATTPRRFDGVREISTALTTIQVRTKLAQLRSAASPSSATQTSPARPKPSATPEREPSSPTSPTSRQHSAPYQALRCRIKPFLGSRRRAARAAGRRQRPASASEGPAGHAPAPGSSLPRIGPAHAATQTRAARCRLLGAPVRSSRSASRTLTRARVACDRLGTLTRRSLAGDRRLRVIRTTDRTRWPDLACLFWCTVRAEPLVTLR